MLINSPKRIEVLVNVFVPSILWSPVSFTVFVSKLWILFTKSVGAALAIALSTYLLFAASVLLVGSATCLTNLL